MGALCLFGSVAVKDITTTGSPEYSQITHGGRLEAASRLFGIPVEQWLDLSTGISPYSWPVPTLPAKVWQRLPDEDDGLINAAASYYGCSRDFILPVPGSQFAIETIPQLIKKSSVAVPLWGYAEHAHSWIAAGHSLQCYKSFAELQKMVRSGSVDSAIVINPNNPTGEIIDNLDQLMELSTILGQQGGFLLVDEAFADLSDSSLCRFFSATAPANMVVLRSVGKFFGLAGLRLGFVVSNPALLQNLKQRLSPWAVNHPARWVGNLVLKDHHWHQLQRQRLAEVQQEWFTFLSALMPNFTWVTSGLFVTGFCGLAQCQLLYNELAQEGILVRLVNPAEEMPTELTLVVTDMMQTEERSTAAVRFGLPHKEDWPRCINTLSNVSKKLFGEMETAQC